MKADSATLKMWHDLKENGDVKNLAYELKAGLSTISVALNGGDCTSETIIGINKYYARKKQLIEESKSGLAS